MNAFKLNVSNHLHNQLRLMRARADLDSFGQEWGIGEVVFVDFISCCVDIHSSNNFRRN